MAGHIHILGICGTFMGSLAQLAKAAGFRVTGCDQAVYPPMSTQLEAAGIELIQGFAADQLAIKPDVVVVGNVISRGNELMEAVLDRGIPYISGPQWLADNILMGKWVLAVAGTHGKTTTSSMLAWILEYAHMAPGYLIGGVPGNFAASARLGESDFFVIEADEYDTAFFDKRSKFVHYRPRTLILNNLEFDHADIFTDLADIQRQCHYLMRTIPASGLVISPFDDPAVDDTLAMGCWSETVHFSAQTSQAAWHADIHAADGSVFDVCLNGASARIEWPLTGLHNVNNALAAAAAARHVGVPLDITAQALCEFAGVKRRMEVIGGNAHVTIYDDFAHHPTAIATTLQGLRHRVGSAKIIAILEPRSNTMKQGVHNDHLRLSAAEADVAFWLEPKHLSWNLAKAVSRCAGRDVFASSEDIVVAVKCLLETDYANQNVHLVVMSNGSFDGIHQQLLALLEKIEVNNDESD